LLGVEKETSRDNDERPKGKKNETFEWDDGEKGMIFKSINTFRKPVNKQHRPT
jgi:hypothetical protein